MFRVLLFAVAGCAVLALLLVDLGAAPEDAAVGDIRATFARKGTRLRERPSALGRASRTLPYGQKVRVTERRGVWIRVSLVGAPAGDTQQGERTGWVRASDTVQPFALTQGGQAGPRPRASRGGPVSQADIQAAGRQFDPGTEKRYRAANPNLEAYFPLVDAIEDGGPTPEAVDAFIRAGRLGRPEPEAAR